MTAHEYANQVFNGLVFLLCIAAVIGPFIVQMWIDRPRR